MFDEVLAQGDEQFPAYSFPTGSASNFSARNFSSWPPDWTFPVVAVGRTLAPSLDRTSASEGSESCRVL